MNILSGLSGIADEIVKKAHLQPSDTVLEVVSPLNHSDIYPSAATDTDNIVKGPGTGNITIRLLKYVTIIEVSHPTCF
jgi:16S rRNA A1518/A1519 N6-dimethyltransferase RsmA/KsgA/DIM1 with predicted DNA glycosylase/AP lyase activity